jgi:hypothetical protein
MRRSILRHRVLASDTNQRVEQRPTQHLYLSHLQVGANSPAKWGEPERLYRTSTQITIVKT